MKDIQRFDVGRPAATVHWNGPLNPLEPCADGDWVRYDDAYDMSQELQYEIASLKEELAGAQLYVNRLEYRIDTLLDR